MVFLAGAPQEPVPVTVGQYNTKFIQICSGLRDGDQVLLSPPFDTKEKDLGGAIIADDEKLPPGMTNQIARAKPPGKDKGGRDRSRPGSDNLRPIPVVAEADQGSRPRIDDPRSQKGARPGMTEFSGSSTNRAELLKRFDTDGDGKLNATEQAAMERWIALRRGTNSPPNGPVLN